MLSNALKWRWSSSVKMMPKIKFRYSWIYDENYRNSPLIKQRLKSQGKKYPSAKKITNYIKVVEPLWNKIETKVLKEIAEISGYKWREREIICYVIGFGRAFSDPLTIRLYKDKQYFIDTLVHELIHQIQIQNQKTNKLWQKFIEKKYKKESRITRNHIIVHAVHYQIYLKLFSKNRLNNDISNSKKYYDYFRAWQIVQEETPEKIIKKFREVTQ